MKAIILNGSSNGDGSLRTVHEILATELVGIGWEVESFILHDLQIAYCQGEFDCWLRTPGICKINDAARDVARAVIQSDLVVFLTPVTFGGYSAELKKALDRLICLVSPFFTTIRREVHHKKRYERYPRLMGVGVLPQPDEESEHIFTTLVRRNAINLHASAHAAGVIPSDKSAAEMRAEIQTLFSMVGVKQ